MLKYTYIDDPQSPTRRPSFTARLVGCSLRAPWAGVANSQTGRHRTNVTVGHTCGHVSWPSLFWQKLWKSRNYLRYFGSFNLLDVNEDILYFVE